MADQEKDGGAACACGGGSCCSGPAKWIWIALVLAIVGVGIARNAGRTKQEAGGRETPAATQPAAPSTTPPATAGDRLPLPRLVDIGAGKCAACKMMTPILEDLKKTYAGKLDVEFIDVWENPDAGKPYGISIIPTQIFYDARGKEVFRHEGFFAKEDILAKWKELGVELAP